MNQSLSNSSTYRIIKIIFFIFLLFASILFISLHFFAYKIKQESEKAAFIQHENYMKRDLHTLCMLDYMINPNGKDILKDCKRIKLKQTKIDTPYLGFYLKYIY